MNTKTRDALAATIGAALLFGAVACSPAQPQPEPAARPVHVAAPAPTPTPEPLPPVTFAPAGDSITAWAGGNLETWATLTQADDLVRVDGFAQGGYKVGQIATQTPACNCDIVVTMVGTNDMGTPRWATPLGERSASLVDIVVKSGARHALILATPPRNTTGALAGDPAWVSEWNAEQQRLAAFYGWDYFDPWADIRTASGEFAEGMTVDGVHPTPAAQQHAADILHDVIVEAGR